jgi:hypothetical protein
MPLTKFIRLNISEQLYSEIGQAVALSRENFGQWVRSRCRLCARREIREKDERRLREYDALHMGDAETDCPLYPNVT